MEFSFADKLRPPKLAAEMGSPLPEALCEIPLARFCWCGSRGVPSVLPGSFSGSGLGQGAFRRRGQFVVLVQARLNFVDDAKIAHELCAAGVDEMCLTVAPW